MGTWRENFRSDSNASCACCCASVIKQYNLVQPTGVKSGKVTVGFERGVVHIVHKLTAG